MILHTYTRIISFEHNYQYTLTRCKLGVFFFFLTVPGLLLPWWVFSDFRAQGYSLVAACGLLIAAAPLAAERRLWGTGLSSQGSQAH